MADEIGFIGLGKMGWPMARRLVYAGHTLAIHDTSERVLSAAREEGGFTVCASPREVAERAQLVLLSLPSPEALHAVTLGADGIAAAGTGSVVIDLSTSGVAMTRAVASGLARAHTGFLDAPVSGGVAGAEAGTLSVMVAGPADLYEAHRDVLSVIGKNVFYVGAEPGQGQAMKLVNNMLSATAMAATAEAMAVATKAGINPRVALEILNVSSGQNTATRDKFPRNVITGSFDAGFATGLMFKDVKLFEALAEELGIPVAVCRSVIGAWHHAMTQGYGPADFTEIARIAERWAGVEIRDRQ